MPLVRYHSARYPVSIVQKDKKMTIQEAQREFRSVFLGGAVGQFVTGIVWLLSAALSSWVGQGAGIIALFVGGAFIFPLTQLGLRLLGQKQAVSAANPFSQYFLHSVVAFGATFVLVYAAMLYRTDWFYPAFMLATGAHYMAFIMFYGMNQFGVLAGILIAAGIVLAMFVPGVFSIGAWFTGLLLISFSLVIWRTVVPQISQPAPS